MTNPVDPHRKTVERLRHELHDLHAALPRAGLVTWTSGNISARVPDADLMVIKPSGVSYDDLTPEDMVVCDLYGTPVEGDHKPSRAPVEHSHSYRDRHVLMV